MIDSGVKVSGYIRPIGETDSYPTHIDVFGKGGIHSLDDLDTRDEITDARRSLGMLSYTDENSSMYSLLGGLTNEYWVKLFDYQDNKLNFNIGCELDYILVGDRDNIAVPSPALIDLKLDLISLRKKSANAKYIIQEPYSDLPNAQALSLLEDGLMKKQSGGVVDIAVPDVDYVTYETFETEINKRILKPEASQINSIAVFDTEDAKSLASSNAFIEDGSFYGEGFYAKTLLGGSTGFAASPATVSGTKYLLPINAGLPTQILATSGFIGNNQLYWTTQLGQVTRKPDDPDDPRHPPIWIPWPDDVPKPVPIPVFPTPGIPNIIPVFPKGGGGGTPNAVPVFPTPGSEEGGGEVVPTPVTIDPDNGDIFTPGDISSDGDLSTQGDIHSDGSISGDSFDFEDGSEESDDVVRMGAPYDLAASYSIELPDAPPIMEPVVDPPDARILATAWRRMRNTQVENVAEDWEIVKWTWSELVVDYPLQIDFEPATDSTNEKLKIKYLGGADELVQRVYAAINNIGGRFTGFASTAKDVPIKIKTSYNGESSSSLCLLRRDDSGYCFKNNNGSFQFNSINQELETLYEYYDDKFSFHKRIEVIDPISDNDAINKLYADSTYLHNITGIDNQIVVNESQSPTIGLAATGVVAGSYVNASVIVDEFGRISDISSGQVANTGDITFDLNVVSTKNANEDIVFSPQGVINATKDMRMRNGASFKIYDNSNVRYVGFRTTATLEESVNWFLPKNAGTDGQVLTTDGINALSWKDQDLEHGNFVFNQNTMSLNASNSIMDISAGQNSLLLKSANLICLGEYYDLDQNSSLGVVSENTSISLRPIATGRTNQYGILNIYTNSSSNKQKDAGVFIQKHPVSEESIVYLNDNGGTISVDGNNKLIYTTEGKVYFIDMTLVE